MSDEPNIYFKAPLFFFFARPWWFVRIPPRQGFFDPRPICLDPRSGYFLILTTFCPNWLPAVWPKIRIFCPDRDKAFSAIARGPTLGYLGLPTCFSA
jgi:hypothetical protein